jgi:hypothetical protein
VLHLHEPEERHRSVAALHVDGVPNVPDPGRRFDHARQVRLGAAADHDLQTLRLMLDVHGDAHERQAGHLLLCAQIARHHVQRDDPSLMHTAELVEELDPALEGNLGSLHGSPPIAQVRPS